MKPRFPPLVLIILIVLFGACTPSATPNGAVSDKASLVEALKSAGAEISLGESIDQPFFGVGGQFITLNGTDIQVFEYPDEAVMESEAAAVAPDGSSIGTSMVDWVASPHFYKTGRIIVLYVGDDSVILDLLVNVVGPQFAGR